MENTVDDLIKRIQESYHNYTKTEKKVADYVLAQTKEVLFMSITDLADACEVGDTSVFRFCKNLGLQGYQEFKVQLSLSLNSQVDRVSEIEEINSDDSFEVVAKKVLQHSNNVLTETHDLIQMNSFARSVNYLKQAENIHFFGVGASGIIAMMAMNKFLKITGNVQCVTDSHMQCVKASMMSARDVAVIISYSGATKDSIEVARLAKKTGAKIIVITKFLKTHLTEYADEIIRCGAQEGPLDGGSTSSQLSQIFILELLYMEFYRSKLEVTQKNVHKTVDAVMNKLY